MVCTVAVIIHQSRSAYENGVRSCCHGDRKVVELLDPGEKARMVRDFAEAVLGAVRSRKGASLQSSFTIARYCYDDGDDDDADDDDGDDDDDEDDADDDDEDDADDDDGGDDDDAGDDDDDHDDDDGDDDDG